jgi:DNA-binding NarL/FixJ family response regulator
MLLESQAGIAVVGEVGNCADAVTAATHEQPNVILLDLMLVGESALDCLPGLRAAASRACILVLTGVADPEFHRQAVGLGAVGVVLKDKAPETLLKAIERVHAGEVWLERTMVASVLDQMRRGSQPPNPEVAKIATLTAREREVIPLIGQGLRNRQIAERLFISEVTVRHHLTSIYNKLGVADRLALVIYAYQHGLTSPPP